MPNKSLVPALRSNEENTTQKENIPREPPLEARRRTQAWIQKAVDEYLEVGQSPEEGVTWFFAPILKLIKDARDKNLTQGILSQRVRLVLVDAPLGARVGAPVSGVYRLNIETKARSFTLNFGLTNDLQERALMQTIWRRCFLLNMYLPIKAAIQRVLSS